MPEGSGLVNGFKGTSKDVPIPLENLEREYCRLTAQDYPIAEMTFARSWMLFRVRAPSQVNVMRAPIESLICIAGCHLTRYRGSIRSAAGELGVGVHPCESLLRSRQAGESCAGGGGFHPREKGKAVRHMNKNDA